MGATVSAAVGTRVCDIAVMTEAAAEDEAGTDAEPDIAVDAETADLAPAASEPGSTVADSAVALLPCADGRGGLLVPRSCVEAFAADTVGGAWDKTDGGTETDARESSALAEVTVVAEGEPFVVILEVRTVAMVAVDEAGEPSAEFTCWLDSDWVRAPSPLSCVDAGALSVEVTTDCAGPGLVEAASTAVDVGDETVLAPPAGRP